MFDTFIILFRSAIVLVFGAGVSLLIAGVKRSLRGNIAILLYFLFMFLIQVTCWQVFGLDFTMKLYPFITHLPTVLFIVLYFKRPLLISVTGVLTGYLCCQIPKWIGSMSAAIFDNKYADHFAYFISMYFVYYLLRKYVANSAIQLIERSKRACMLFASIPLLYYLFDYVTTIYTNLLYSGAREAVQFSPTLMCTLYLVFIILYYKESQKQIIAQRERDLYASQFQQARLELETMRQMQENTVIYRHDMRHHLSMIGIYAGEGDLKKIKDYLASTKAAIDALTPIRYCENETVNLILSNFDNKAKKTQVTLQTDVKLPVNIDVNDTELCALLSNALENAITAAAQVENEKLRKVYLKALISDDKLVISTENAYAEKITMEDDLPITNKKEAGHGFGIKSMISIVESHGGLYSIETGGGVFVLQLLLPLGKGGRTIQQ